MAIHSVDVHAGMRLRQRRFLLGMSQSKLGAAVALSFQRVHKYERGTNRMGSSRLFEFARALDVPVYYFFDDVPGPAGLRAGQGLPGQARDARACARLLRGPHGQGAQETLGAVSYRNVPSRRKRT